MTILQRVVIIASVFAVATMTDQVTAAAENVHSQALIDPTRPANLTPANLPESVEVEGLTEQKEEPVFTLQAIKIARTDRLAVINGQTVKAGEVIGLAKVKAIQADAVLLDVKGQSIRLSLLPNSIKRVARPSQ